MQISRHFFSRKFSDESECRAAQSAKKRFHHLSNLRFTFRGSRSEIDFPFGLQSRSDQVVPDQFVCTLFSHSYSPMRLNSKWALDRPPRRCRIDLLDFHGVAQKAWEILKITIE